MSLNSNFNYCLNNLVCLIYACIILEVASNVIKQMFRGAMEDQRDNCFNDCTYGQTHKKNERHFEHEKHNSGHIFFPENLFSIIIVKIVKKEK